MMNIISPKESTKPTPTVAIDDIPMLPFQVEADLNNTTASKMKKCPVKDINAYALFVVLEKQRNMKLKELYNQRLDAFCPSTEQPQDECDTVSLPKLPPRYQNLKVSAKWLMLKLRMQRPTLTMQNEYKTLDHVTKTFLDDTASVMQAYCEEQTIIGSLQTACADVCYSNQLPSMHKRRRSSIITPPSSPRSRRVPRITLDEEVSPFLSLSLLKSPSESVDEVDLTDDQIMSIYKDSEGTDADEAVVLNTC
jgi:hypothetical protein